MAERIEAINVLTATSPGAALPVLLEVGSRPDEPGPLLEATGAGLGRIQDEGFQVTEFDLRNLAAVAAEAFSTGSLPSELPQTKSRAR